MSPADNVYHHRLAFILLTAHRAISGHSLLTSPNKCGDPHGKRLHLVMEAVLNPHFRLVFTLGQSGASV